MRYTGWYEPSTRRELVALPDNQYDVLCKVAARLANQELEDLAFDDINWEPFYRLMGALAEGKRIKGSTIVNWEIEINE